MFRVARDGTRSRIVDVQGPVASAVDAAGGNLYVTTASPDNTLYKILPGSTEPTRLLGPADGVDGPRGIAIDKDGNVFVASETSDKVFRVAPDGTWAIVLDGSRPVDPDPIDAPFGVAVDSVGNLYVTGNKTHNVIKRTPAGVKSEILQSNVDDETLPKEEKREGPREIAVDASGRVYVTFQDSNKVVRLDPQPGGDYVPEHDHPGWRGHAAEAGTRAGHRSRRDASSSRARTAATC